VRRLDGHAEEKETAGMRNTLAWGVTLGVAVIAVAFDDEATMMLNASTAGHCGAKVRRDKTRVFQPPYRPATPAISRTNIPPLLWSGGDYYGRLESSNRGFSGNLGSSFDEFK